MKTIYRKKLEKASGYLREVYDELESEDSDDFDTFGSRLDDLAGEIDDLLEDDENRAKDEDDPGDDEEYEN